MTFTAIVVTHNQPLELEHCLEGLFNQTRKADEIIVLWSGMEPSQDYDIEYAERPNLNDWGHDKRAWGLEIAMGDYLGFFNADDSYDPAYIEKMLDPDYDISFCNWNEMPNCDFLPGRSTSGNFIVRTKLARQVGYPWRHYEADAEFINALGGAHATIRKVPELLYYHNELI